MTKLTADDIVDLGRWHFIQFKDESTAQSAMEKYHRFVERQRMLAQGLTDGVTEGSPESLFEGWADGFDEDGTGTDLRDDEVDDQDERAA